jgi:pilus assembly protein Flp/PilA
MLNKFSQKGLTMIEYVVATLIGFFGGNVSIKSQKGVTMIEYALIASLVAIAAIVVLNTLGTSITSAFQSVVDAM